MWLGSWGGNMVTFRPVNERPDVAFEVYELWSLMRHQSVAQLISRSAVGHCAVYVLEHLPITLEYLIYQLPSALASLDLVARMTLEAVAGLEYLHGMHVMHRNLRPQSIYLNANMCAKREWGGGDSHAPLF